MEEMEQVNSDVSQEVSSEPQTTPEHTSEEQSQESSSEQTTKDTDNLPFHQHPRWQEVLSERNSERERANQFEKQISELRQQMSRFQQPQAQPRVENPLLTRLKGIDPEFGKSYEELNGLRDEMQQFKDWQNQMELSRVRTEAYSTLDKLHAENKVADNDKERYNKEIELMVLKNPSLGLKDLPNLYKQVHDSHSKYIEGVRRAERESYLASKKADAAAPTGKTKGSPVSPNKAQEYSKDPEEARAQLIARVVANRRASGSL